jgi:hypothetical protein
MQSTTEIIPWLQTGRPKEWSGPPFGHDLTPIEPTVGAPLLNCHNGGAGGVGAVTVATVRVLRWWAGPPYAARCGRSSPPGARQRALCLSASARLRRPRAAVAHDSSWIPRRFAVRSPGSPRAVKSPDLQNVLPAKAYGAIVQNLRAHTHLRVYRERVAGGVLHL